MVESLIRYEAYFILNKDILKSPAILGRAFIILYVFFDLVDLLNVSPLDQEVHEVTDLDFAVSVEVRTNTVVTRSIVHRG